VLLRHQLAAGVKLEAGKQLVKRTAAEVKVHPDVVNISSKIRQDESYSNYNVQVLPIEREEANDLINALTILVY